MKIMNLSEIVKGAVTVEDALRLLSIQTSPKKRIPCPIHHGEHNNFAYNDNYFICFSCGAKGDIFTLLKEIKGIGYSEAVSLLNEQFRLGLPVGKKMSAVEKMAANKSSFSRKKELKLQESRRAFAENEYWARFEKVLALERIVAESRPKDINDDFSNEFIDASKELTTAREELAEAEIKWGWVR